MSLLPLFESGVTSTVYGLPITNGTTPALSGVSSVVGLPSTSTRRRMRPWNFTDIVLVVGFSVKVRKSTLSSFDRLPQSEGLSSFASLGSSFGSVSFVHVPPLDEVVPDAPELVLPEAPDEDDVEEDEVDVDPLEESKTSCVVDPEQAEAATPRASVKVPKREKRKVRFRRQPDITPSILA